MTPSISVSNETKLILKQLRKKGESYDQILQRLIKLAVIKKLDDELNEILETEEFIPLEDL